jgi:hypothetical protein
MSTPMPCSVPRSAGTCYTMPRCLKPITIGFRSVLNRQRTMRCMPYARSEAVSRPKQPQSRTFYFISCR